MFSAKSPAPRRRLRLASSLLIAAGLLVLLVPAVLRWRQPPEESPVMAGAADFRPENFPVEAPQSDMPSPDIPKTTPAESENTPPQGVPIFRLEIPRIGVNQPVQPGIENTHLDKGPGHYPNTKLPGHLGNAAIAGHRTLRLKPSYFYRLNELKPGDPIRVVYADRTVLFAVEQVFTTSPYDLTVLHPTAYPALTLTTCDPPGSDERRLIVRAKQVEVTAGP
ncbi:MAG TPA: class E sortase [Symbiobacteriaceae bacterium]|jgi:sortase A|nr:class E sortase [Symbiobacteriaceae bacterium]